MENIVNMPRPEILMVADAVAREKNIDREDVFDAMEQAIQKAGRSKYGFEHDIHTAILVTANLKAFLSYEVFQAYVDGGLYAMNLINALHSMGIGTIPLSLAFQTSKLQKLQAFGIPENEVPILIIGAGYLPDNFNVAVSDRKPIEKTNTFH